jgi:myo-inositol-1(or 4)-monophosphatase
MLEKKDNDYKDFLSIAAKAALEGGKILKKYWGKVKNVREKTFTGDLVTEADKESEEVIIRLLNEHYPTHTILSEEGGLYKAKDEEFSWVIDPLDGTTNYTHQYPFVAVSIGFLRHGKPIVGAVFNPITDEMFLAAKGKGAFLNGNPIKVSKVKFLNQSLLATGFAYDRRETLDNNYTEFCFLTHLSHGVRRVGSAALDLAYVAAGRLEGFWERGLNPWDIAAGVVLIEEAGGKVSSYEGEELILNSGRILASNGLIHENLILELKKAHEGRLKFGF